MPGNYFRCIGGKTALLLLIQHAVFSNPMPEQMSFSASSYVQNAHPSSTARVALKDLLTTLEGRYKVRINYIGEIVNNIQVLPPSAKADGVQFVDYLNNLLKPLGLEAEQAAMNQYIIYRLNPAGPKITPIVAAQVIPVQQVRIVSGTVTDENGIPLPGVTVLVKGTNNGVHTSNDGKYTLKNVPEKAVLVFSFIGFKAQEININNRTDINVKLLTDIQSVKDVVITGYQEIKKDNFTGTAITISGEELKRFNPQNILASLQSFDPSFKIVENNINGSNPNKLPNINVRGTTALPTGDIATLNRNNLASVTNLPTFIMDGYEVSLQTIFDLDPNRVASMTLLKDAAATAVYGSRAANGVLVIVTKAPKEGMLALSYNYELTVTAPDLTDYRVLNAKDKLEYERLAGVYTANMVDSPDELEQEYYRKKKNVLSGINTYWLSQPVATELGHKHSIYLEGGSKAMRYGVDARYQTNDGVMKGSFRKRYSLSTNLSYNLNNKFRFMNQFTISQVSSKESPYREFSNYVKMNPYYPKTDSMGRLLREVDKWGYYDAVKGASSLTVLNPMYEATTGSFDKTEYLEFVDAFSIEYNITDGLKVRGQASLTKLKGTADKFVSPFSNDYFTVTGDDLKDRGKYTYGTQDNWQVDGSLTMNYFKQIGSSHYINLSLGTNIQDRKGDNRSLVAQGFTNDRFSELEFARRYEIDGSPDGSVSQERLIGGFLSTNYSYQNRFLVDGTIRVDASSKFGTDSRMAPFWALGLGWNVHNEHFMSHKVISQLKLRATTGLTGDVSFPAYLSNTTYQYYSSDWYSTGVGTVFKSYGNQGLKWQRTRNFDLGLELGLFRDRIYISPRYYYKLTKDLLADVIVPPSTGFTEYKENLGEMVNKGYEVTFRANVYRSRNVSVNLTANAVRNDNKITKISNALKSYNDKVDTKQATDKDFSSVPLLRYKEGQSLYTIYAVKSLGIDPENGKEIFVKKDGTKTYEYDVKDMVPVGDQNTKLEGFFGGSLNYKNWMTEIKFYGKCGGDMYNQTLVDRVENADPRYNVDSRVLSSRWKQPGDHVFFKNIADQGSTKTSSRFVQRENVLELKSIYLAYDSPASFYKRLKMQSLRFSVNMNDIWRTSTIEAERGIDYPFARSFTFSLSTRF
ncbi:SusC/RagA family TonB-linked outer membrane protein [Chitinophaga oryziterrae]|uniref:SusC/RagA family TonB-linked outer membrane protein n=1 Tax=Chitinophaga oryziterrae TaxID=1031224 RepID=A0A6N8JIE8_9BACT|nr:SusC/RagA family TonB-linked outer membrane protein [Chitinophaga oryziterrae]MVT44048.1 SusC/RagA family TonB-linked outer membrane protein [Chitinophaga oryziterrae]